MRNHPAVGILGTVEGATLDHLNRLCHARIHDLATEPAARAWWEALAGAVKVAFVLLLNCPDLEASDRNLICQQLAIDAEDAMGCHPEAAQVLDVFRAAMVQEGR
jgi:hypothetical protein